MYKRNIATIAAMLAAALWLGGCGSDTKVDEQQGVGTSVAAVLGNDFTGNYVKIRGERDVPADAKYPCLNEFEVCLALDPTGATASVQDLCPSDDSPNGTWDFTHVVYSDAACTTPLANLGCVPTMDEWISPGHNHNDVVCITRNADKDFDLCVMDPVTGAGSEACPPCLPSDTGLCNPVQ